MPATKIYSVDVENNEAIVDISPNVTYVFNPENVRSIIPRSERRGQAHEMMSAAEYLVRCARQLIPQSSENLEIFDSILKDLDRLEALVHENCRGRVAPCLVCFRLPWLSDRTRA